MAIIAFVAFCFTTFCPFSFPMPISLCLARVCCLWIGWQHSRFTIICTHIYHLHIYVQFSSREIVIKGKSNQQQQQQIHSCRGFLRLHSPFSLIDKLLIIWLFMQEAFKSEFSHINSMVVYVDNALLLHIYLYMNRMTISLSTMSLIMHSDTIDDNN